MTKQYSRVLLLIILLSSSKVTFSQKKTAHKYPSVLWEITGNGLKKPSYLFGTMHVSSKMVFHLSDSFYHAIKNVDAVALELNPELWQKQMVELDKMKMNYINFVQEPGNDYLTENSFRIQKYDDDLKNAMSSEPTVVNSLLYRTSQSKEDFEENTFLDLYIFQTGRRLGKRGTGVENYYETEKLVMEAYSDMANEKKKKTIDTDGQSMNDIMEKMQDAYRRGDLDLLDSLNKMTVESGAFEEKFLYRRDEIQANSIDTILKKSSLFVGVGAAHLPGARGVIELLRKKGYILRPIKMGNKETTQKGEIDKLKVPVTFKKIKSADGFYSVDVPGQLYKMADDGRFINRKQYSDMCNGSYYLVTRVRTYSSFLGQSEKTVLRKVDSLLFENIPGKILSKKDIIKNGYRGYDITNKTRRGDIQRYNIFVTPYEIILFKMGGNENYVQGPEAEHFFSSIQLKELSGNNIIFTPKQGGFSVKLPQPPLEYLNTSNTDGLNRWEYEALDKTNGDDYLLFKKSIYNFSFLEEDTFDLKLIEESFRSPDFFDKQLQRKISSFNSYPCLDVKEIMKDSSLVSARYIIRGPQYYVIAVRSKNRNKDFSDYFNSFHFTSYQYPKSVIYTDTFLNYKVTTPVVPQLDESYRATLEKINNESANNYYESGSNNNYWQKEKNAWFYSDSTGEGVSVSVQKFPKYYYIKDSADLWKPSELKNYLEKNSMVLYSKETFKLKDSTYGIHFMLRDNTGSSRTINRMSILKDEYLFHITTLGDTINNTSDFITSFFKTFSPALSKPGRNIFLNTIDTFFADLFSKDSLTHTKAQSAIESVDFTQKDIPKLVTAINKLSLLDKDYFDTKSKLIAQLGDIKDSTKPVVVDCLKKIYEQVGDTSVFQNAVIIALTKHQTKDAILIFKQLMLQDPPVFDDNDGYTQLFTNLQDSLQLASQLFPDILQLTTVDDYKEPVTSLLVTLIDSGLITTNQYENYFSKIYFDAKIELKKQQNKEQEEASKKDDDDNYNYTYSYNGHKDELNDYAVLLTPFYDKNPNVPKYLDKLIRSSNKDLQLNTAVLLLKNNKQVADSIFLSLAADDRYRSSLYSKLNKINRLDKFPAKYKTQLAIARSNMVEDKNYSNIDSIVYISKQLTNYKNEKGIVYFFKYRIKKDDDWKIGISGLQPVNEDSVSTDDRLSVMTDKNVKSDEPLDEQLQKQLKRLLFIAHKSARNFFEEDNSNYLFKRIAEYGD